MKKFSIFAIFFIIAVFLLCGAGCAKPGAKPAAEEPQGLGTEERNFVALGSSLSKGNNLSSDKKGDNLDYSFSAGSQLESVFVYLKSKGENLAAINLASSGATTGEILKRQVSNAVSYHPKYITLDCGADFITGVSVETFRQNLTEIIAALQKDGATILIMTYPDFTKMRAATYASCKETENIIGGGIRLENLSSENVERYNRVIRDVAVKNNLLLVDLYKADFGPEDVSDYDCLHFNLDGQKKVAQEFINVLK